MHNGKTTQPEPFLQCVKCKTVHCCHSQSIRLTACNTGVSFAADNRSNVRTTTNIVKHLIQTSMKKNLSSQSMDAALQDFLGNKPSMETPKPEPQPADTQEQASEAVQGKADEAVQESTDGTPLVVRRISGKQRRASLEEYKETFLPVPTIEDRKPVFLSRTTRDALDRIVRMFGERRMSVSGLVENIARQHLATYGEDIETWRKL
jgi:hypothetical protein